MIKSKHLLDFNTILATNTHDMKNSLFMLLQSIENLDLADNLTAEQHQAFADLHYQTSRINSTLMQLLALYRDDQNQLPLYIEENSVTEMLNDVIERNRLYLNSHKINVTLDLNSEHFAYFDQDLITYLISDVFVNALRHCKTDIILRAFIKGDYLAIQVEDDGAGYPSHMLAINDEAHRFNATKGRSGLGLLFAKRIAAEHKTTTLNGYIQLENKQQESGSIFTLYLP